MANSKKIFFCLGVCALPTGQKHVCLRSLPFDSQGIYKPLAIQIDLKLCVLRVRISDWSLVALHGRRAPSTSNVNFDGPWTTAYPPPPSTSSKGYVWLCLVRPSCSRCVRNPRKFGLQSGGGYEQKKKPLEHWNAAENLPCIAIALL